MSGRCISEETGRILWNARYYIISDALLPTDCLQPLYELEDRFAIDASLSSSTAYTLLSPIV